ncbi:MAG: BamA/TamA family outer membrane protein [Myxococcales bacterium]|nr:BamA/TamA family outer membrane protein [Myxococcales bacterium]
MRAPRTIAAIFALGAIAKSPDALAQEAATATPSQPMLEPTRRERLVSVHIEPALTGEDPWARVAMPRGVLVDDDALRAAVDRAVASGTFADIRASVRTVPEGIELVLRGERRTRMTEVRIEGIDQRALEAVRADFSIASMAWVTQQQLDEACGRVVEGYRLAGYRTATARALREPTRDPDYVRVLVTVSEGRPTRLASVRLFAPEIDREFGPRLCDSLTLWPTAVTEREAACRPIVGSGEIAEGRTVRAVSEQMTAAVRRLGYYGARLDEPSLVPMRELRSGDPRVELRFTATLGPQYTIAFEGVRRGSTSDLREALRLDDERTLDEATLGTLETRVRDWYARRALSDAQVQARIERISANASRIVLRVNEGEPVYVRTVSFSGARAIEYGTLREILDEHLRAELPGGSIFTAPTDAQARSVDDVRNSVARGPRMPLVLHPERTFVAEVYQEAARRMASRYRELGYLDATVELDGEPQRDRDEAGRPVWDVTFRVVERSRVSLTAVQFDGNNRLPSAELATRGAIRVGGALSLAEVAAARDRLAEHYRESGYNYVRVGSVIDRSPDGANARVRFVITEGPLVRVTRVEIRGLRSIGRALVYDRLALREGEVFRPSLARESQRRLGELGYFSAVTVSLSEPDVESSVKTLVVQVAEAGGSLEARGGVSAWELLRGSVQWTRRNVLNSSISMTASLQAGVVAPIAAFADPSLFPSLAGLQWWERLRGRAALSLQFPPLRTLGTDFRPGVDFSLSRSVDLQFAINGVDLAASTLIRPNRIVTITPLLDFQVNNLQLFNGDSIEQLLLTLPPVEQVRLGRLLLLPRGTTLLSSIRVSLAIDQRDQVFNPQRGTFISVLGEFVGILGYIPPNTTTRSPPPGNTLRTTLTFAGYITPVSWLTLATNVRVGANFTFDSCNTVTYPNRQYFLGGAESLRGWLQDSVIPADVLTPPSTSGCSNIPTAAPSMNAVLLSQRSGDAYVLLRQELRFAIGSSGVGINLFVDVGNIWKDLRNVFTVFRLQSSPGIGIRYVTPIGPVGIDLGFPNPYSWPLPAPVVSFSFSSA